MKSYPLVKSRKGLNCKEVFRTERGHRASQSSPLAVIFKSTGNCCLPKLFGSQNGKTDQKSQVSATKTCNCFCLASSSPGGALTGAELLPSVQLWVVV